MSNTSSSQQSDFIHNCDVTKDNRKLYFGEFNDVYPPVRAATTAIDHRNSEMDSQVVSKEKVSAIFNRYFKALEMKARRTISPPMGKLHNNHLQNIRAGFDMVARPSRGQFNEDHTSLVHTRIWNSQRE